MRDRHILVHYHLRPGGVTTVLREQARVLTSLGVSVQIISGEAPPPGTEAFPVPVEVVPELGYQQQRLESESFERVSQRLSSLAGIDGLLHFHNPTLGKNPSWMALINRLAASGHALLLQIHDFGEDHRWLPGREPADHTTYYPRGGRIRWLVLHPDDRAVLVAAGLNDEDVAVLPNPVSPPGYGGLPAANDGRKLVLYPARGIRRKNPGEFLLLAALAPPSWEFRSTLPPRGEAQERVFRRWARWAGHLGIRALLGSGQPTDRPDLVISTSVREGFGYSFAEPWLAGVPATGRLPGRWLVGRDGAFLPEPAGLYRAIRIPTTWLRAEVWRRALRAAIPDTASRDGIARRFGQNTIDFADLPETEQRNVLRRIVRDPEEAAKAITFELTNGHSIDPATWFRLATENASSVPAMSGVLRQAFSPAGLGVALRGIAASAREARGGLRGHADASMVAGAFHTPGHFQFVRLPPS